MAMGSYGRERQVGGIWAVRYERDGPDLVVLVGSRHGTGRDDTAHRGGGLDDEGLAFVGP